MTHPVKLLSVFVACACILLAINFGLRSSMGFFMAPISTEFGYGREVFAFSLALQNLCWGLFQPIAGAVADRFGTAKAILAGALLYALGLYVTSTADSIFALHSGAGILIGMGIAGTGFGVVLPALARMVAPEKRAFALGLGTAAGSAGQLLLIPVAQEFISSYGWQTALLLLAGGALCMMFLAVPFRGDAAANSSTTSEENIQQTLPDALKEASGHIHYWLLIAGFFVCGFQLAFITVHMPAFLSDEGFDAKVAVISLSLIGLFNIFGCLLFGSWSGKYSKKNLLGIIYASRAVTIALFMLIPISTTTVYVFSILTGFLWLATVPPTSGLVAQMFGLRHMGTLYGIVFLNHQLGSFLGVWLGGYLYDETGAYDVVWWSAAAIALLTALIHIVIDERPVARLRTVTA
ncbi:MFS transporter [Neptunomonas qingdaonensis]|uniref:Predicted arabinose efflux permease, MFS family n=1 Tax=Neptunomonas qingdaonensis TaxID=1045558 RepID=A0A1I2LV33_9GAMM|nr:MFS transporter [Neptunomonas qingdaonensis]SFF80881.1 Predicted arabinose efflux permease, MFS family [Neptunomonas qingdaonensis]